MKGKNRITLKNVLILIGLWFVLLNPLLVLADTNAPDNYDFRVWQGAYTSITNLIQNWGTQCDTNPANDADDGSGGYSCNLTVGTSTSPTFYTYEGNVYAQMRVYHEPDVGQTYNYSYTTCGSDNNESCNTYSNTSTVSGTFLYNINYDSDINDCNANEGATACNGHTCYNASWTFESGTANCCGDDASESFVNSTYSGSVYEACCNAATDCVKPGGTCAALNDVYGCYKCSASNAWSAVTLSGNQFKIQNKSGIFLMAVDVDGDVQVYGNISTSCITSPDGNDFQLKNSTGSIRAWLNNSNGDLCLAGAKNANQASITPAGNDDFIVKNTTGTVVFMIDMTSGNMSALKDIAWNCTIS